MTLIKNVEVLQAYANCRFDSYSPYWFFSSTNQFHLPNLTNILPLEHAIYEV
jgi:hypothetical protein